MNHNNSEINWKKIDEIISSNTKILLTTHENPDGDGLGSEVAMYHHLIEHGKDARIINCSPTPDMFDFINLDNCIETFNEGTHIEWIKDCDIIIVFDVGNFNRTRDIKVAGYIYIKAKPETSLKRIIKRNRPGETITLEYLEKCHKAHNEWLDEEPITLYLNGEREGETSLPDNWDLCIQTFIKTNTPDEYLSFNLLDHPFF